MSDDFLRDVQGLKARVDAVEGRLGNITQRAREVIGGKIAGLEAKVTAQEAQIERLEQAIRGLTP